MKYKRNTKVYNLIKNDKVIGKIQVYRLAVWITDNLWLDGITVETVEQTKLSLRG